MKTISIAGTRSSAGAAPHPRWHAAMLLRAPHRLAFFLAMLVLAASGLWWALVQLDRAGAGLHLAYAVSPTLTHSTVMTFGFFPLFFSGFLFTAGPKWLGVHGPSARVLLPALSAQAAGWFAWLLTAHLSPWSAAAALLLSLTGLASVARRFVDLVVASPASDRVHAKAIAAALVAGCASLAGVALALVADAPLFARACVLTGLWAFVVVVYSSVAHRMIPFFTSSAVPMVDAWRPFWALWLMLGVAIFEAMTVWVETYAGISNYWLAARGIVELIAAAVLVWLVFAWGLVQSMKVRLLAMLHLGFLWLGLALALSGVSRFAVLLTGAELLPLVGLHALAMGALGSLMLAMVTRVSCGHSGRALVADNFVWLLFWLLQVTVLLRLAAAVPTSATPLLLAAASTLWAFVMLVWGLRYGSWYGRARADGRPG